MSSGLGPPPGPPRGLVLHQGWLGLLDTYDDVARVTVTLMPVALLAAWLLASRRQLTGTPTGRAWRLSLSEVGIVYLTVPALWLTLMPGAHPDAARAGVSLVPVRDLATMSTFQIVGNLLLLAGLGFFIPVRFPMSGSLPRVMAIATMCSALIETTQHLLPLDRVASLDDVLLNTAGAGLAALASRRWWQSKPPILAHPG